MRPARRSSVDRARRSRHSSRTGSYSRSRRDRRIRCASSSPTARHETSAISMSFCRSSVRFRLHRVSRSRRRLQNSFGSCARKPKCWSENAGVMEYWSVGFKSRNGSDFCSFTFGYLKSKHGSYFSLISTIHHSNTPRIHHSI